MLLSITVIAHKFLTWLFAGGEYSNHLLSASVICKNIIKCVFSVCVCLFTKYLKSKLICKNNKYNYYLLSWNETYTGHHHVSIYLISKSLHSDTSLELAWSCPWWHLLVLDLKQIFKFIYKLRFYGRKKGFQFISYKISKHKWGPGELKCITRDCQWRCNFFYFHLLITDEYIEI